MQQKIKFSKRKPNYLAAKLSLLTFAAVAEETVKKPLELELRRYLRLASGEVACW